MEMQKKKLENSIDEETYILWMTILYWYGKFLIGKNRVKEAKSCFRDCYLTSTKVANVSPNQIMVILYNLSEVCLLLNDNEEALKYLLKGVSLGKKNNNNSDLAYFYVKLGKITIDRNLYEEASFWCVEGKKLARKFKNFGAEKESDECLKKIQKMFVTN